MIGQLPCHSERTTNGNFQKYALSQRAWKLRHVIGKKQVTHDVTTDITQGMTILY